MKAILNIAENQNAASEAAILSEWKEIWRCLIERSCSGGRRFHDVCGLIASPSSTHCALNAREHLHDLLSSIMMEQQDDASRGSEIQLRAVSDMIASVDQYLSSTQSSSINSFSPLEI
eukprot:gnl/TRDRNA2_/TRDRNA2_145715_c1_seq1.p1 gnl/TRDRNA2_/TRDRNA2_145715_c1~~gnl/TRDRNA2_/TRDRNA2_145715_c1_seq1.p1  ORF type:complete len:118 (-),score=15.61 gnl/TRDRNA2_/TRDRNA2_145715_c1_seq1:4-357(-)